MNSKTYLYSSVKPKAIQMRKSGFTYAEISTELGHIPKGTLSNWMKDISLTETQQLRIKQKMLDSGQRGRQLGAWANKDKRTKRLNNIRGLAYESYKSNIKHPLFLAGLLLYIAEGSKKTEIFSFMNSDFKLILVMMRWIETFSDLKLNDFRFRLYIHEIYKTENCEEFWINELKIKPNQLQKTIYKPTERIYKKNPSYKGCMRLELRGSDLYWKTMYWRDCFYETIKA